MKKLISLIMIIMMMLVLMTGSVFADTLLDFSDPDAEDLGSQLTGGSGTGTTETPETPEEPGNTNTNEGTNTNTGADTNTNTNNNTNTNLPETGIADTTAIVVGGVFCAVVGIYAYRKMKYYADI